MKQMWQWVQCVWKIWTRRWRVVTRKSLVISQIRLDGDAEIDFFSKGSAKERIQWHYLPEYRPLDQKFVEVHSDVDYRSSESNGEQQGTQKWLTAYRITRIEFSVNASSPLITTPTLALRATQNFCSINSECCLARVLLPKLWYDKSLY